MLKIKDEVDLDSLLDFEFEKYEYSYGTRYERTTASGIEIFIYAHNRIIQINRYGYTDYLAANSLASSLVDDLVDAGYVEDI